MTTNTGTPYELITREIFQEILNQEHAHTVEVKHNVKLTGKTGAIHQIDVFWAFEFGGIQYTTVVQAKDWGTAVDQGKLLQFQGVLEDLPGQPRGIVVTKTGYQRGAAKYARAHDILLYELAQIPDPPQGPPIVITYLASATCRIGIDDSNPNRFMLEVVTFDPKFSNTTLHVDRAWVRDIQTQYGQEILREILSTQLRGFPHEIPVYDADGNSTGTLREVYKKLSEEMRDIGERQRDSRASFEEPTFFKTSCLEVPLMKVDAISTRIDIQEAVYKTLLLPNFVEFVLTSLSDGKTRLFRRPRPIPGKMPPSTA